MGVELDSARLGQAKTFLFDIEGTICSIAFVKDVLYPYFLRALPAYLKEHWDDSTVQDIVTQLPQNVERTPEAVQKHFVSLVEADVKDTLLKQLQGHIWTSGYHSGSVRAPLYPDVIPFFSHLKSTHRDIAIYSSGSVKAQRLLFDHVDAYWFPTATESISSSSSSSDGAGEGINYRKPEDLKEGEKSISITRAFVPHGLDGNPQFYDTVNAGPKTEAGSYEKIVKALGRGVEELVFFSDNPAETRAAKEAGLSAVIVVRPGNAPLPEGIDKEYPVVENYDGVRELLS